jgi:hypothetical protein
MTSIARVVTYLSRLSNGKLVLWCYLVWYLSTVVHHFDPSPGIWLNSLGISAVIGVALMLSVSGGAARNDPWQAFRLFAMPFCVSSFSSLIKGKGFLLVFPPSSSELAAAIGACLLFAGTVMGWRRWRDAERA